MELTRSHPATQVPDRAPASRQAAMLPHYAMPCHAIPFHAMPFHSMPCHATPCHAVPCHAKPYYDVTPRRTASPVARRPPLSPSFPNARHQITLKGSLFPDESLAVVSCAHEVEEDPAFQWDADPVASVRRWRSLDRIPADNILFAHLPTPPSARHETLGQQSGPRPGPGPSNQPMPPIPHAVSYTGQLRSATWCLASQAKVKFRHII